MVRARNDRRHCRGGSHRRPAGVRVRARRLADGGALSRLDVPDGPQDPYQLDRLIGLSKLSSYDQQRLGLDEVDFVLDQVAAKTQAPNAAVARLTAAARGKLDATLQPGDQASQRRDEDLESLAGLHVDLLTTLTAAGSSYGKAYGLGRALADTARPKQDPAALTASFHPTIRVRDDDAMEAIRVALDVATLGCPHRLAARAIRRLIGVRPYPLARAQMRSPGRYSRRCSPIDASRCPTRSRS